MSDPNSLPMEDSGLRCLTCGYNLTGLSGERCPECGVVLNWKHVRAARDARLADAKAWRLWREGLRWVAEPGTPWDSWRWYLKPVAFVVTLMQVALMPWYFARKLPRHPRLFWAVCFTIVCLAFVPLPGSGGSVVRAYWTMGAVCSILLQSCALGAVFPLSRPSHPWGFWLAVCCYASYPLLVERLCGAEPANLMPGPAHDASGLVWPLSVWAGVRVDLCTSVLFYVWWLDLLVIWWVRARPVRVWRLFLAAATVPAVTAIVPWILLMCSVGVVR